MHRNRCDVSAIACGVDESETLTHTCTAVTVRDREMVIRSTLVQVFLNGVSVVALVDGGSDINLLGPRLVADHPHWKTHATNVELNFGNASQGTANRVVMNTGVSAGNVAHTPAVDFFVSSQEIPGCDIILGTPFLTYAKAVGVEHESQAVVFPKDKRCNGTVRVNVFPIAASPDMATTPNIRLVGAKEAANFLHHHRSEGRAGLPSDGRRVTRHCSSIGKHGESRGSIRRGSDRR